MQTFNVPIKRRSFWGRLIRVPRTWVKHVKLLRRSSTPLPTAMLAATRMTCILLKAYRSPALVRPPDPSSMAFSLRGNGLLSFFTWRRDAEKRYDAWFYEGSGWHSHCETRHWKYQAGLLGAIIQRDLYCVWEIGLCRYVGFWDCPYERTSFIVGGMARTMDEAKRACDEQIALLTGAAAAADTNESETER